MDTLNIKLENCYGIKSLVHSLDFSGHSSFAIYAPNGSMKSSLAQTFDDIAGSVQSRDRVFPTRATVREITDESGTELAPEQTMVIRPYDEVFTHTEKTSTLLVNAALRKEYEALHADIDEAKEELLSALREQSGTKKDVEAEVSATFTKQTDALFKALLRIRDELESQKEAPFAEIQYDTIFDEKVAAALGSKDFKAAIHEYIEKYNELLDASTYFKRGTFTYYNAATIAKNLATNGFFEAAHTITFNADEKREIGSKKELEELIQAEKESILADKDLQKRFAAVEKILQKNASVRAFQDYLAEHDEIVPHLDNIDVFREEIWKSYILTRYDKYTDLIEKYQAAEKRKDEIEQEAAKQHTKWKEVIDIFNERFFVPFKLTAKNRVSVILGQEPMLKLGFEFVDAEDTAEVARDDLMQVLSTGEKKALYILNIIFEVEARKKANQPTVFVFDDIADSFDYKNKYAIIQYMRDIADEPLFRQIILTHNFDFFRTVQSRFVRYSNCLMVTKDDAEVTMQVAEGIKNVFVNDWRPSFFTDPLKRAAAIPFIRNIIEYTKGDTDPDYLKLTSLLHWKSDSPTLLQQDLDAIFNSSFGEAGAFTDPSATVVDAIHAEANACLTAPKGINMANKVVLSIATRLAAEKLMVDAINDPTFVQGITANQTPKLLKKYKTTTGVKPEAIDAVERVILMTPENIHLNSFMYEPILDMSDDHLRKLYTDICNLK